MKLRHSMLFLSILILALSTPVVSQAPPDTVEAGQTISMTLTGPTEFTPTHALFCYRHPGEQSYVIVPITGSNNMYDAEIPGEFVTERGIEYFASFFNDTNTGYFPDRPDAEVNPAKIVVVLSEFVSNQLAVEQKTFHMISIPVDLADQLPEVVIEDDYQAYDPEVWRMFHWLTQEGAYIEYDPENPIFNLLRGRGFWLITRDGLPFDVEGWSFNEDEPFIMTIEPGWNQIGNPFPFTVDWGNVTAINGSLTSLGYPYSFDGVQYDTTMYMRAWEGYFIQNTSAGAVTLSIPPIEGEPADLGKVAVAEPIYQVRFSAKLEGFEQRDSNNHIGFVNGPSLVTRMEEPPPIEDNIRLHFTDGETTYMNDYRELSGEGAVWQMSVYTTQSYSNINIDLTESGAIPAGQELYILDEDLFSAIEHDRGQFTLNFDANIETPRHLRVIIGTENFANLESSGIPLTPVSFDLKQNYPNPFNPETTIPYQVHQRTNVELAVFNLLGQRVRSLVSGVQNTGFYEARWNGRDDAGNKVVSGVYLVQFTAAQESMTRKMILIR